MSILAERKRKQKWILNPRGNDWSKDTNKFGQKLLEKMGWTPGKGLGANEDGITEHIKVKYKSDVQGMGYELRDDQWTKHEDNFTELLANLGSNEAIKLNKPKLDKSLEKKSQISRARVHYHKFTRCKDLAIRSEKDIANIFGRKTLEKNLNSKEEDSKSFGVISIKSGNMKDYFMSKLSKLGKFSSTNSEENHSSDSETDISPTVGFGFLSCDNKQNFINFISPVDQKDIKLEENNTGVKRKRNDDLNDNLTKKMKKKAKKKHVVFDNEGNDINVKEEVCYDNPCLNKEDTEEQQSSGGHGLDNLAFNDELEQKVKKSVSFASPLVEYSTLRDDFPKKMKKKNRKEERGIDNPACEEQSGDNDINKENLNKKADLNYEQTVRVKKSKKKNIEKGTEYFGCDEYSPQASTSNKKSKKLKSKNIVTHDTLEENVPKKNKKKRKSFQNGITNLACEEAPNCVDNLACSVNLIEEGIESITNAIDSYQTELENEMNQRKDKNIQKGCKFKRNLINYFEIVAPPLNEELHENA